MKEKLEEMMQQCQEESRLHRLSAYKPHQAAVDTYAEHCKETLSIGSQSCSVQSCSPICMVGGLNPSIHRLAEYSLRKSDETHYLYVSRLCSGAFRHRASSVLVLFCLEEVGGRDSKSNVCSQVLYWVEAGCKTKPLPV